MWSSDVESSENDDIIGWHEVNCSLHKASCKGDTSRVQSLLEMKVDHEIVDKYGDTALDYACYEGHVDIVILLLEAQEYNVVNEFTGWDLDKHLWQATRGEFFPLMRVLAIAGAVWWNEKSATNKLFLSKGLDGTAKIKSWMRKRTFWTQLHFACEARDTEFVQKYMASDQSCVLPPNTSSTVVYVKEVVNEEEQKLEREKIIRSWTPLQCASSHISSKYSLPVDDNLVAIIKAAYKPWSSMNHKLYPISFRSIVYTMLLVVQHRKFAVNSDILSAIFCFAGRDWWKPEWEEDPQYRHGLKTEYCG